MVRCVWTEDTHASSDVMGRLFRFLCIFCLSLAGGCAHSPYYSLPVAGSEPALQDWVAEELAPELARQLGEHPRFKGESVILVKLEGPDVQPDIDGLTRSIREQLLDTLLRTPGVRLPWQPQHRQEQHHRRLDQVDCTRIRDAHYFVGIEISPTVSAQFRVSVRALDVQAGEWVSGFGKSWQGRLTPGDGLKAGRSDIISFTALGNATSCTIYLNDGHNRMLALRIFGATARVRILEWRRGWPRWRRTPL